MFMEKKTFTRACKGLEKQFHVPITTLEMLKADAPCKTRK